MPGLYRGRFAPSPTGDLHLGTARTALVAWLAARAAGGEFLVRVEDLDTPRVVPGAEERLLEDLRWLGLDWDGEVVRQSERIHLYEAALARLDTFPCTCSRADVQRAASAPHAGEEGPRYLGTCRDPAALRPRTPAVRVRVQPGDIEWLDLIHGAQCDDPSQQVGDFVVRRADGMFAYQLAVVVDDAAQGITDVVRGDDLLSSTARQIHLYRALGQAAPRFAHVPLVLGPDGQRLSKRHGSISVRQFDAPERVVGQLAATLGLCAPEDSLTPRQLIARFDLTQIPRTPATLPR
jgi:glutamyl-tRNA synthetase